jgi:3-oxoadipate enol-lactonase
MRMPTVTSIATDVHHVVEGPPDAPALVLLNSLGSSLAMWEPQIEALASRFRVVRFDSRGHGRSPVPAGPYSLADLGTDVIALLDRLGIAHAHLTGLSLGGMTAMWLGIHAPERIDRVVLCCTSAKLGPPGAYAQRAAQVRAEGTASVAQTVVSRWVTPPYAEEHPTEVARLEAMVAATPAEGYASSCEAIETMDIEDDLARITAPTLVIAGAEDPATPPDHGARIAARIPGTRMTVVPHAAHLGNLEQAAEFTALIEGHLGAG